MGSQLESNFMHLIRILSKSPVTRRVLLVAVCLAGLSLPFFAHVEDHPSVHDTVAGILVRLRSSLAVAELLSLDLRKVETFLTGQERRILATEHISFRVNVPVQVSILRDLELGAEPFWLKEQEFLQTQHMAVIEGRKFDVWQKTFERGRIGLGVNSLRGGREHYVVVLSPTQASERLEISEAYPGFLKTAIARVGERAYVDRPSRLESLPAELDGKVLLRTERDRRNDAQLLDVFRVTSYPATLKPDQVVLTWSDAPRTSMTVQWRTSILVPRGVVSFSEKGDGEADRRMPAQAQAATMVLETPETANDPVVHRHTAVLRGLKPGTHYVYTVGDGTPERTSPVAEFTTAPAGTVPFSFIYMGDAQNGLDRWGELVRQAFERRPDAAFYIMAGDLVNRGRDRDDWDQLFFNAEGIYNRRPLVPAIGNHEVQGKHPTLYLKLFTLPTSGPEEIEPERAYAFQYSNALFVILDSNLPPSTQAQWLERQLAGTKATWKFVVYHHPVYSSAPGRDNPALREVWVPIFDRYRVDMALQGHDHAYLRTYPMKGNQRAASPQEGTVYIISVSGTKMYDQVPYDYTEFGMTNVSTYQLLDLEIAGNRLVYRAYDLDGTVRDHLIIEK